MGGVNSSTRPEDENVSPHRNTAIRQQAMTIYLVAVVVGIVMWMWLIGPAAMRKNRMLWVGAASSLGLVALNGTLAWQETVGTYPAEKAEADRLGRDAFYLVAAVFSVATVMTGLQRDVVSTVLPLLMLAVLFGIIFVLCPVWVSTVDPEPTILLKHVRTVFVIYGIGFLVAALATIFHRYNQVGGATLRRHNRGRRAGVLPTTIA